MRLQDFVFFICLVIICERQCSAVRESSTTGGVVKPKNDTIEVYRFDPASPFKDGEGHNDNRNSPYDDDDYYSNDSNERYRDDDDNGRYRDNDDNSYENKPSYRDDDEDDDDYRPPSRSPKKRYIPDDLGHMNIYLRQPSRDGKRRKPERVRLPTARYERRRFPNTFGPLISLLPWVPIFADRLTKQTIIYSPTGGIYIIPPVINFYGKLISVAELIASGYASLVQSGAPPPPAVNVAPLVKPGPVVGPGIPAINPSTGGFSGGVQTNNRVSPRPDYSKSYDRKPVYTEKTDYAKPNPAY